MRSSVDVIFVNVPVNGAAQTLPAKPTASRTKKKYLVEACTGKIPISYPVPLDGFNTLNSQKLTSIAQIYSDLRLSSQDNKKNRQNMAYWTAVCGEEGIPSNKTIAKNCLLGYKRNSVDEQLSAIF